MKNLELSNLLGEMGVPSKKINGILLNDKVVIRSVLNGLGDTFSSISHKTKVGFRGVSAVANNFHEKYNEVMNELFKRWRSIK